MPLKSGHSRKEMRSIPAQRAVISENIRREVNAGKSQKQAVAISLNKAGVSKNKDMFAKRPTPKGLYGGKYKKEKKHMGKKHKPY